MNDTSKSLVCVSPAFKFKFHFLMALVRSEGVSLVVKWLHRVIE